MTQPNETANISTDDQSEAAVPQTELEALQVALAVAEAKSLEHRDLYMRALAEMENMRKRAVRDVEQAHKYALEKFANDLVGVKDSLEMGLAAGTADAQTLLSGTEATLKLLAKSFEKAGVLEVIPQGQPFNPELHEAMVSQESPDHPANTVIQVIQKGYQLNGRLLRPARVIVSR